MLILVTTPIGNLGDMPPRGIEAMKAADVVLCEDTRVTRKLTTRFGVETRLVPLHDHNEDQMIDGILYRLRQGQTVVLVSDAGMPLISDPGYRLVRAAVEAGDASRAPALVCSGAARDLPLRVCLLGGARRRAGGCVWPLGGRRRAPATHHPRGGWARALAAVHTALRPMLHYVTRFARRNEG